ncbi:hypothetical protein FPCIR_6818 [Fusarium pseudocircinatum]|uniref:Uncharacterized protein n=1 Tax=Fusarium pseudocircinatum TaxID=56676 RepID=A0A8H5P3Z2_9HYPO|nr:hypothetical protein FPCIR_6818 [Fusarium pseudocircinatum]
MSSSKKKKASREDSVSFETPLFSDLNASHAQNSREDSEESNLSWINDCLKPATSKSGPYIHNSNSTHEEASMETPGNIGSNLRDASYDIKDAGTGHHDNRMSKLPPGQFREPSLRRGYGMPYQAPKALDSMAAKGTSQIGHHHSQIMDTLPETQTQSSISVPQQFLAIGQRLLPALNKDGKNVCNLNRPQARRGDLQPAGYRPVAMRPPGTSGRKATNEKQGHSSGEKRTSKIMIDLGCHKKAEQEALLRACLEHKDLIRGEELRKDKWRVVKGCVEKWCEPRRFQPAENGPAASGSELENLLDQWNVLYANKFCSANRDLLEAAGWRKAAEQSRNSPPSDGTYNSQISHESNSPSEKVEEGLDFEGSIWPTVKDELMKFAEARILRWAQEKLEERLQALESLTRPPLLKANSSPESYRVYLRYLMDRTEAAGKNSKAIRNTEAVMSMALDLLPGLEERLRDQLEDVVDKQEDRPGAGIKHDQTNETDHGEANDGSENAHENSGADHDIDHKIQEAQEDSDHEDEAKTRLEDNSEEDEDGDESGDDHEDFEEFYADESDDDTYQDPDEPDRQYRGSIIDSIEPRTPIVTPRVMRQLRRYEQKYRDTIITAKTEEETASAVIRSVDKEEKQVTSRKRKSSDSVEPALAIRSKSMDQKLAAVSTPTPVGRKRQRLHPSQCSPASTACSSELLPSLEDLFSSSIDRASSVTTQPPPNSSSPAVRAGKKKSEIRDRSRAKSRVFTELGDTPRGAAIAPQSEEVTGVSPGLFVTPDPVEQHGNTPFAFKRSVSHRTAPEERFREETAEFQAMTPSAREAMLYTALRDMRRRQG